MTKKYYAIVRTNALKYKKRFIFPCMNAQLPIYWNKKVARTDALKYGNSVEKYGNSVEVVEIEL